MSPITTVYKLFPGRIVPDFNTKTLKEKKLGDCTHSTVTACLADQRAQDFYAMMDRGSQPTTSSANVSFNSQRIYHLIFEQFAQPPTSPDLSQFRFYRTL